MSPTQSSVINSKTEQEKKSCIVNGGEDKGPALGTAPMLESWEEPEAAAYSPPPLRNKDINHWPPTVSFPVGACRDEIAAAYTLKVEGD